MHSPSITLPSITGVEVQLRIAGPGSRSYAFIIDWHIRLILALAWSFASWFLSEGALAAPALGPARPGFVLLVVVPAAAIYFLYHPVLEVAMRGRTPGKRMAGVRLVTEQGDIPGAGALLLRNVFRLLDSLPLWYLVGLLAVMFTRQHVRVGDLAAGTVLVLDQDGGADAFIAEGAAVRRSLTPQAFDLVHDLLGRWAALQEPQRSQIARSLLQRIEPALSQQELAQLDSASLRARLSALLSEEPAR